MECTLTVPRPATTLASAAPPSLLAAFAAVPDPRRHASITYALPALLALAVTAILANQLTPLAMAEWAARQEAAVLAPLGFAVGRTPRQSTLHRLFARLDGDALSAALSAYFAPAAAPTPLVRGGQGVAIDGKAHCGRLQYAPGGSPVHALTAYCHAPGVVLAHEPIEHGPDKSEAELTVAPRLIARLDWCGRVLTGDALFCQRALSSQVLAAGGDYLFAVKANQPTLHDDLVRLFDPPPGAPRPLPLLDCRTAVTLEQGHGRTHERRQLIASTDRNGDRDWPGVAQVIRLERTWRAPGHTHHARHYAITSLPPEVADAPRLLALKRGHWSIENGLHFVKDRTCGEDQRLVHLGAGPTMLALLRDTAVSLLHRLGCRAIASRLRAHADQPHNAVALVIGRHPTHA